VKEVLLKDYRPTCLLNVASHVPERARFPVIDVHNHIFGELPPETLVEIMDAVGIQTWVNVTGNAIMPLVNNAYTIARRDIGYFMQHYARRFPGRFAAMTMADFAQWGDPVLVKNDDFAKHCVEQLETDVAAGAMGLKITKELGLFFRDHTGAMLRVDDERLSPIWERAGALGVPVLMHISDPIGLFQPIDERNEQYLTLREFPGWSHLGSEFGKWDLLEQRNKMIARHPRTTFLLPHVANLSEDLASVGELLDAHSNVFIDFAASIDELGRQPYTSRDFFLRYQDRILFGLDLPVSAEAYRCHFRFLERDGHAHPQDGTAQRSVGACGRLVWRRRRGHPSGRADA